MPSPSDWPVTSQPGRGGGACLLDAVTTTVLLFFLLLFRRVWSGACEPLPGRDTFFFPSLSFFLFFFFFALPHALPLEEEEEDYQSRQRAVRSLTVCLSISCSPTHASSTPLGLGVGSNVAAAIALPETPRPETVNQPLFPGPLQRHTTRERWGLFSFPSIPSRGHHTDEHAAAPLLRP